MPDAYGRPVRKEQRAIAKMRLAQASPTGLPLAIRTARLVGVPWSEIAALTGGQIEQLRSIAHGSI